MSALAAPAIISGTKSACPGASSIVRSCLVVLAILVPTSIVTPLSRSASSSSITQAKAKEAFPISAAKFLRGGRVAHE